MTVAVGMAVAVGIVVTVGRSLAMTVGSVDVILVPQGAEYSAVCRGLRRARNTTTTAIALPVGVEPVRQFLHQWQPPKQPSDAGDRPVRVLVTGLCGSLSESHHSGDIVVYRDGVYVPEAGNAGQQRFHFDDTLASGLYECLPKSATWVTVLTTDTVIRSVARKHLLRVHWNATVVDMESYAVCYALAPYGGIAIAGLRAIADDGNTDLPDVGAAIDAQGNLNPWRLLGVFLQRPLAAVKLIRSSLVGLAALEEAIAETQKTSYPAG